MAVDDEHLVTVQAVAVSRLGGGEGDALLVPPAVVLGQGQGGDGLAAGYAREVLLLGRVVTRGQDGVGRQSDGGEVGGAQQSPAHLLEDDPELHVGVARPAVLLGDGQALEAQLLGHLAPYGGVVPLGGLHQPAHLGGRRLVLEEAAD